jgi:hypothetical protein
MFIYLIITNFIDFPKHFIFEKIVASLWFLTMKPFIYVCYLKPTIYIKQYSSYKI